MSEAIPFNRETADYFELSVQEAMIVALIEKRFNRAAIAAAMHIAEQTIRNYVSALCEDYDCRMHELPERIRERAALDHARSEISESHG